MDKSKYSTVERRKCLDHVQWMKAQSHQSRTVNPSYLNVCIALVHSYVCLGCVCGGVDGWCACGGGGGGGLVWGDLRPPSPVSQELQ